MERRKPLFVLAGLFLFLLAVHVPAFVCMPPDADVTEWDLCARTVLSGGAIYRDAVENNLPGMLWVHLALRPVVGWSSEAFRVVDLLIVTTIISLLLRWLPEGCSATARLAVAFLLAAFYLSTSEWCHCQRDTWMLLPALLAVSLRRQQIERLGNNGPSRWALLRPLAEGLLWGFAFWIKPFVAVPALFCWVAGVRTLWRRSPGLAVADGGLLVLGGLLAGVAGSAWLIHTGAWADFWEIVWVWNRGYATSPYDADRRLLYLAGFLVRLFPWLLIHLIAVPLACRAWWRGDSVRGTLLSALYLGWLLQAVVLQRLHDYPHVPPLFLGMLVLSRHAVSTAPAPGRRLLVAFLVVLVALTLPGLTARRLEVWPRCWREGSSAEVRDRLRLLHRENWEDLGRVAAFLREEGVGDGELTCFSMRTLPLYFQLDRKPATRHFLLENILASFRRQRGIVNADLARSRQRYVVCDVLTTRWKDREEPTGLSRPDPEAVAIPEEGLVFRSGRYAVYGVDGPSMPGWLERHIAW